MTTEYSCENKLLKVVTPTQTVTYDYDYKGRRISQTIAGKTTLYVYGGAHILCEYTITGVTERLSRKYVYGPGVDEPIKMTVYSMPADLNNDGIVNIADAGLLATKWLYDSGTAGFNADYDINCDGIINNTDSDMIAETFKTSGSGIRSFYYHFDGLGSVIALSDETGQPVELYQYDVYGTVKISTPTWYPLTRSQFGNRFLFTGREFDAETGLYNYRARIYNPAIGRFLQTDPIGYGDGINWYAYCGNDPVNYADPSGQWIETAWDAANVVGGAISLGVNIHEGNWGWAALDTLGLTYDVVATIVPFLPGGASAGLKAARASKNVVEAVDVTFDVAVIANKTNKAAKVVDNVSTAQKYGSDLHDTVGFAMDGKLNSLDNFAPRGRANRLTGPQPDFPGNGIWADITTKGQWRGHVRDYTASHGDPISIIYKRGKGVTSVDDMWRLRTGASVGLGTAQWGPRMANNLTGNNSGSFGSKK